MKNEIEAMITDITATTAEAEDYTGEDGLLYCGKCHTPKEAYFPKETAQWLGHDRHPTECDCQRAAREKREAAESRQKHLETVEDLKRRGFTDPAMRNWTFEHDNGRNPQTATARFYVESWETMQAENIGYLFWGGVGTGKSYLAACIANALMEKEVAVCMTNFATILNDLAASFYREIFKVFKGMFARIFMTGVSPVTLDDLTSGFNIGWHISTKAPFNQMLGFSTEDVRDLFTYYKNSGDLPADTDVEAIIEDMKPWYDNYCFSEEALRTQSKVFNCDMVLYYLRNYMETGEAPRQMIDPNTKTDYNKMKKLLQLDKLDGDRKGVIMTIAEKGEIVGNIEESFPAKALTNPEIFISLLFYYGMLTIKDTFGDQLILGIPNNNVRKQYYNYLLEQYQEEKYINTSNLKTMFTYMAFEGKWKECLEYMAKAYAEVSSVRDGIEAERNLQGFFMAYFSLNNYYYTAPELELSHGYCDFFLLPNLTHYPTKHSYIIELKVLSKKEFDTLTEDGKMTKGAKQWLDAEEQIKQYAKAPRVEALRQGTTLHKIIMQFKGWELARIDEVNEI